MTFLFVVLSQIKIGDHTLEVRAQKFLATSAIIEPLQEVAHGGVLALREAWKMASGVVGSKIKSSFHSDNLPGKRHLNIQIERSKSFIDDQLKKVQASGKQVQKAAFDEIQQQKGHLEDDLLDELKSEGFKTEDEY